MTKNVITFFLSFVVFAHNVKGYCDVISFLQNVRFKLSDERLCVISSEARQEMVNTIHDRFDELEKLTELL